MTTDDFTTAARADELFEHIEGMIDSLDDHITMADVNRVLIEALGMTRSLRDHLAAQEPDGPRMAPFGLPVTADGVREVWDAFVKPSQADDAPPQSIEMRELMAILRWAHTRLSPEESPAARAVGRDAR